MELPEFIESQIATDEGRLNDPHDWYHNNPDLLAKCDVARRILALHRQVRIPYEVANGFPGVCGSETSTEYLTDGRGWSTKYPCETIKALGVLYSDRDGYREDWHPSQTM